MTPALNELIANGLRTSLDINATGNISVDWAGIGEGSVVTSVLASLSALFELPLYDGGRRQDLANAERDVSLEVVNLYTALGATTEPEQ